jgi:hypothetical protein
MRKLKLFLAALCPPFPFLYKRYTIEIWGDILEASNDPRDPKNYSGFPEAEQGPNLRQHKLTKKWKIGRESYSFPFGKLCYSWQPIRDDLAKQLLKKIEAKEIKK